MPTGMTASRLGKEGESTFVAMQLYYAMNILRKFAEYKQDKETAAYLDEKQEELGKLLQELCWNEDRFIRGFTEAGEVIGKRTDPEAKYVAEPAELGGDQRAGKSGSGGYGA